MRQTNEAVSCARQDDDWYKYRYNIGLLHWYDCHGSSAAVDSIARMRQDTVAYKSSICIGLVDWYEADFERVSWILCTHSVARMRQDTVW